MEKFLYFLEKVSEFWKRAPKGPLIILILLFTTGIFADFLAFGHDPEVGNPRLRLLPPFWYEGGTTKYPLGTDTMGRDVLTRLIYGSRVSLLVAFAAVIVASVIGTILGILAGYHGGWVDQVVMRFTDAWLSIPTVMFGILLAVIVGPGVFNIVIIMGLVFWTRYARVTRGETLSLKEREFVQLAIVDGCSKLRIMRKHILPNVINNVITLASMQIGIVVVVEASLTFLGVGVPPPKPAWGLMLSEGRGGLLAGYWWLIVFPGVAIAFLVMSFNLMGDWLRLYLDPHYRHIEA
ncbi:MAG: ABC transporter permease [Deltaproteobacteria bacterium]|nr:ABC transporter permease [Deltaproteobacteria bacterium]